MGKEIFMQQTTNYQLNQWEATDKLSRADFNADNCSVKQTCQWQVFSVSRTAMLGGTH